MPTNIGVIGWLHPDSLKRELLLFDELVVPDLYDLAPPGRDQFRADLEWLAESGLVTSFGYKEARNAVLDDGTGTIDIALQSLAGAYALIEASVASAAIPDQSFRRDGASNLGLEGWHVSMQRFVAAELRRRGGVFATPIVPGFVKGTPESLLARRKDIFPRVADILERFDEINAALPSDVDRRLFRVGCSSFVDAVKRLDEFKGEKPTEVDTIADLVVVTLNTLPTVSPLVDLEAVADFARDPSMARQRARLHRWLRRLSDAGTSQVELEEELLDLMDSYESHLRVARLEHQTTWLETLITVPAEVAESLVKFRFGKLAGMAFTLRRTKAALQKAELEAPGREVAYLLEARGRFTSPGDAF